jgi:NAD(P)-dependent dehydrogenase (short-subunit alcohol dehydrogenase family)
MARLRIVITGASLGLGWHLSSALAKEGHEVIPFNLDAGYDVRNWADCERFAAEVGEVDILINNAGINLINYLEDFPASQWDAVMDTNAKGIFHMSKAMLGNLKGGGTILNIVSNAAHMPMTASLAYNASKGAAHIMTLQLARELKPRHGIDVFGIAPNKLAGTGMSASIDRQCQMVRGWTEEYARQYQLKSLPAGEETDPATLAEFITFLLSSKQRHKYLTGCIIPYGA